MRVVANAFHSFEPRPWFGRYSRIPGESSVFHLIYAGGRMWPVIYWETEEGTATCAACQCDAAQHLANAVERAKRKAGGSGGGAFIINEYGQVLVPASDGSGRRYLAGELQDQLLFENPFDEAEPIDLGDCRYLQPGDPWKMPYVGSRFNLSRSSSIYCFHEDENGGQAIYPERQDHVLIRALRNLRRTGAVRFIVNHHGVVLTKCPIEANWSPEECWHPFYVGRINSNLWFEKEDGDA